MQCAALKVMQPKVKEGLEGSAHSGEDGRNAWAKNNCEDALEQGSSSCFTGAFDLQAGNVEGAFVSTRLSLDTKRE